MRTFPKLADSYAYATECNLATLSMLVGIKRSSKHAIERQQNICLTMLRVCHQHEAEIYWGTEWKSDFPRVKEILDQAKKEPEGIEAALIRWRESQQ
jgi:hypothetical protein